MQREQWAANSNEQHVASEREAILARPSADDGPDNNEMINKHTHIYINNKKKS